MQQYKKPYKLLKHSFGVQEINIIINQNIITEVEIFALLFATQLVAFSTV